MATIKVTYNSISRRFNITSSTSWVELESKLRSLYNIPSTSSLNVSYKDEDGDIITLSSDLELKEVLAQQSSGKPIKLVLNSSENVIVQEEEREEDVESSRPPSYHQHASVNDEEEEELEESEHDPLLNKEKEKEESESDKQHDKPEKEEDNKNEDDEDDEIIFVISYPWVQRTLFEPSRFEPSRFGPSRFGPSRFGLFNGFGSFGCPFNFYERPRCYRPSYFGNPSVYYSSSRQCEPNACGQKSNACNRQRSAFCNKNAEASTSTSASTSATDNKYNRPSCGRNFNYYHPRCHNQTPLNKEQLNDKLSTLHSMGFDSSNDALYEDLLKRYNGNIERVVELLLRNQQVNEHYDNENNENEKASTSKSKGIVINENDDLENKPYNL